jgi:hypothetical protein
VAEVNARMDKWRAMGYKIALWRDHFDQGIVADIIFAERGYPGFYVACNNLILDCLIYNSDCDWMVCAGDDTDPDPTKTAGEIERECTEHFVNPHPRKFNPGTFGVMQPTGHRWGDKQGAYIDRVAGSPWIGREFARRVNGGKGPWWPEYFHQFGDEELQAVATKLGVFWQRPDLTHFHQHWGLPLPGQTIGHKSSMPPFLAKANSPEHWRQYKALFEARKAAGFPGHEVIA